MRVLALALVATACVVDATLPAFAQGQEKGQQKSRIIAAPGRTVACYNPVNVPPKVRIKRIKIQDHRLQYEKRNGRIELVDYPPVFKEIEEVIEPEHVLLKPIPCN